MVKERPFKRYFTRANRIKISRQCPAKVHRKLKIHTVACMWPSRCAQLYRFKMAPGYPGIHGLTVQLPCLKVFSSFILPSRACQKQSFDDVSTVASGAEGGVKTRQADRSPQSLRSTKIRAWLPWPTARPETFCGVLATLVVWTVRVSRSMELSIGCVHRPNGCVRRPNDKGRYFPFKPSSISF